MQKLHLPILISLSALCFIGCTTSQSSTNVSDSTNVSALDSLEPFKWENRILILFATGNDYQASIDQLQAETALVEDRDMVWFVISENGQQITANIGQPMMAGFPQSLIDQYQQNSDGSLEVVLIGKDGGVKYRADELNTDEIYFEVIDVMPMRQSEMREEE